MIIKTTLLALLTIPFCHAATPTTKKISSPQVGRLQAEYPKATELRKKEIRSLLKLLYSKNF